MDKRTQTEPVSLRPSRMMGLDLGEKTIGVAVSDELGWTAQPHGTLQRGTPGQDLGALRRLVEELHVSKIIVGLPKHMKGTMGSRAREAAAFAEEIGAALQVPVVLWDERLSTVAANRVLLEADLSRRQRKAQVDKIAAALILQSYLDSEGRHG